MDEIFALLSQGHDSDIKIRRNMSCGILEWVPLQGGGGGGNLFGPHPSIKIPVPLRVFFADFSR